MNKTIKIKVETSKRIFCFYALLNFLGYDPEILPTNTVRKKARLFLKESLADHKEKFNKVKNLIEKKEASKEFWFPLRTWILCHGQPPEFKEVSPYWKNFMNIELGGFFEKEIKEFWKVSQLPHLWKTLRVNYAKVKEDCYYNAKKSVEGSLNYLKIKDFNFNKFVVIPNFLEEYNRGIGPKIDNVAYAILGPSKEGGFPIQRIEHEFLHSIINPITKDLLHNQVSKKELSIIREGLIHAIVLRLNKSNKKYYGRREKKLKESGNYKFVVFLKKYEEQKNSFKDFF
ncbi:MAG: hypothetical protein GF387_01390, partial [Candidatus Portnoybacteria bacterium]|nr:hypothetical protein [Candidatus Portnoybacteria bacterium]